MAETLYPRAFGEKTSIGMGYAELEGSTEICLTEKKMTFEKVSAAENNK